MKFQQAFYQNFLTEKFNDLIPQQLEKKSRNGQFLPHLPTDSRTIEWHIFLIPMPGSLALMCKKDLSFQSKGKCKGYVQT